MDISAFETKETTAITIKNPRTGVDTDAVITVHGVFSGRFRQAYIEYQRRNPSGSIADLDSEALATLTESWAGLEKGGKPYKFSKANAIALYGSSGPMRNQIIAAILESDRFLASA